MKPEELTRYERMYRAMQELMGTKLLRFSFPAAGRKQGRPDRGEATSCRSDRPLRPPVHDVRDS